MKFFAATFLSTLLLAEPAAATGTPKKKRNAEIEVVNLTYRQPFSPPFWMSHRCDMPKKLFKFGARASNGLALLAETGSGAGLMEEFPSKGNKYVCATGQHDGPIRPSERDTIKVRMGRCDCVSMASMLIHTNDAFVAINGMNIDYLYEPEFLPALDAGSETNDELCKNMPGPACATIDERNGRNLTDVEGFVHVHRNMQDVGDLIDFGWLNPTAKVSGYAYEI